MSHEVPASRAAMSAPPTKGRASGRRLLRLSLTALGIVFGDIGTSPLYAFRESFHGHALAASHENVLGVLSLVTWALLIVVSLKYVVFVLGADNQGEGGILALTALVTRVNARRGGGRWFLIMLGLFGTALLYGDGMITPAISVLAAVEGLGLVTPVLEPYVAPLTVAVLVLLFAAQSRGTGGVGRVFGPVMVAWFVLLAALGMTQIVHAPSVLAALNPLHAATFFARNGLDGVLVLGSIFLVVTGGEALYADLGHFGTRPIRLPWFGLVLPALLLNYWGQGALVYRDPAAAANPFFLMVPAWALVPVVLLATLATVVASQALVSGVFSLTRQAVQLGYVPRLTIRHTSSEEAGQVYVPAANAALMLACIALVLGFRSSSGLAAAYGVAVSTDMVFTTLLLAVVMRERWGWRLPAVALPTGAFLAIDLIFLGGNLVKIPEGGWVPLAVGAVVFTLMTTWNRGRRILAEDLARDRVSATAFVERLAAERPRRVPGTAVYMSGNPFHVPAALSRNLEHHRVLHERVLFVAVETEEMPRVIGRDRLQAVPLGDGIHQVILRYGFAEHPDVPRALRRLRLDGAPVDPSTASWFLGHETVLPTAGEGMALWRERLFAFMARNAQPATAFFGLPPERVVEIGAEVRM